MNCNSATLIGRVTRDPEAKKTPSGTDVVNFSLATNHTYKGKDGQKVETTTFHNLVAWGKQAEIIATYVKKGQELYIRGRIDNRTYEKKDGTKGYTSEIIVEDFQLGARARGEAGAAGGDGSQVRTAAEAVHEASITQGHDDGIRIEDIPF